MASENAGVAGLAGRYATALFELADEQKALDQVESDLKALRQLLDANADFKRFVSSPILSREDQVKGIAAVGVSADLSPLVRRFLGLIASNRRLFALPAMITAFLDALAARRGAVQAEVVTAQPLSDAQQQALRQALAAQAGGEVSIDVKLDPGLLGGLVVKVGSRMVDSSIRTKLQRLQLAMKGVG